MKQKRVKEQTVPLQVYIPLSLSAELERAVVRVSSSLSEYSRQAIKERILRDDLLYQQAA
jgi:hypothetical protein